MGQIRDSMDITQITFDKSEYKIENKKHWAVLRFKRDSDDEPYLDILAGEKNEISTNTGKNHFHVCYTVDLEEIYVGHRNRIHKIKRTLDSNLRGRSLDKIHTMRKGVGEYTFSIKTVVDRDTNKLTLQKFEFLELS